MESGVVSASSINLQLDLKSYWLHARGEGGGADYDLVMDRDEDGLPMLRGKHVAGLLRLALKRAVAWKWLGSDSGAYIPLLLMGGEDEPGCLDVRSARVPAWVRRELLDDPQLRAELGVACCRRIASTAIDELTSVAKQKQLRSIEAAVPLPLGFQVSFAPRDRRWWAGRDEAEQAAIALAENNWLDWLEIAWPAFDEAGAKRTRGFGRLGWAEFRNEREIQT
jgi:hypothetical protein